MTAENQDHRPDTAAGQPSADIAAEIAAGGHSEHLYKPIDPVAPCPRCGFYTDTPNHFYGCQEATDVD